jgi:hypothetical protein
MVGSTLDSGPDWADGAINRLGGCPDIPDRAYPRGLLCPNSSKPPDPGVPEPDLIRSTSQEEPRIDGPPSPVGYITAIDREGVWIRGTIAG